MIPKEILKKVREIEITTSRLVTDVFAGQYHSVFKGEGIEFDEVREYQYGDDIRSIDWNVTARTGKAHIKKFVEERELTVFLLIDASASCRFGTANMLKSQLAAEVSALIAYSAIRNNDKIGLIIFTNKIEKFIPPRKGSKHVLRTIREILYFQPQNTQTDITLALDYLNHVSLRKSIAFLLSDFYVDQTIPSYNDLKKSLVLTNKRHDLIALTLNDRRELEMSNSGLIQVHDAESNTQRLFDGSSKKLREKFIKDNLDRIEQRAKMFSSSGLDYIDLYTDKPYTDSIVNFFNKRKAKRR